MPTIRSKTTGKTRTVNATQAKAFVGAVSGKTRWEILPDEDTDGDDEDTDGDDEDDGDGYDAMKLAELRQLAEDRDLPSSGKKAELAARLREDAADGA